MAHAWMIGMQVAEWLSRAMSAARNKREQQFARVVEHSGVVVAALRALDREAHRLFLPMLYGDITTWTAEQRQTWSESIVALAYEDKISSALRISIAALRDLATQQSDQDVGRHLQDLHDLVTVPVRGLASSSKDYPGVTTAMISLNVGGWIDWLIGSEVDSLVEALKRPEDANTQTVRRIVKQFIYEGTVTSHAISIRDNHFQEHRSFRTRLSPMWQTRVLSEQDNTYAIETPPIANAITTLRPYAEAAEEIFGRLLALQNRIFPLLPTPIWAWQSGQ